jgi:hypothetical protein
MLHGFPPNQHRGLTAIPPILLYYFLRTLRDFKLG